MSVFALISFGLIGCSFYCMVMRKNRRPRRRNRVERLQDEAMVVTPGTPSAATPKDIHMKVRAGVPSVTNALPTMFQAQPNVTVISVKSTYAGPTEPKLQETKH
eukprot:308316_1